ncbi:MAG: cytochrome c oxidase subunit II [Leptolyngbya sp. IPPAS B-1204]|nr:cytochrome c oxidase subunit II [Elainella sp. C42_A2020_010]RNJ66327.1 MAG: cytochrome c oxidase subunit II [Leptolyngbya sp. IPPAS B-1204]
MNIPNSILTMLAGIALTLVSLWYGQNHGLAPVQASADAVLVDDLFNTMMTVGMGIFLLVEGVLIICMFKFRRKPGDDTDGPPIAGNIPLEILWTAIPVVIVLVIGVYSFEIYRIEGGFDPEAAEQSPVQVSPVQVAMLPDAEMSAPLLPPASQPVSHKPMHNHMALGVGGMPDQMKDPDLTVNVMGLQYAWIFTYQDTGVTAGELHLPADKDVKLVIKAQDVLHAFWLPQFRLKQDAIPGQDAELRFTPTRVGEYPIICAELCGPYHGAMASKLYVQPADEFDQWLQQQIASQPNSDQTVAAKPAADRTDADYLATFAAHNPVDAAALEQLHPHSMQHSMSEQAAQSLQPAA